MDGRTQLWQTALYAFIAVCLYATQEAKSVPRDILQKESERSCETIEIDHFVVNHALGWMLTTYWLRNPVLAFGVSLVDEVSEHAFQRIMPNWVECWWDRWLLDIFGANLVGVCIGAWILGRTWTETRLSLRGALLLLCLRTVWFFIDFLYKLFVFDPRQVPTNITLITICMIFWRSWFVCQIAKEGTAPEGKGAHELWAVWRAVPIVVLDLALHYGWGSFQHMGGLDVRAVQDYVWWGGVVVMFLWASNVFTRKKQTASASDGA